MSSSTTGDGKVRENRLRRAAARQGLRLVKSARRDPRAIDYGVYWIVRETTGGWRGRELQSPEQGMTLDEVEDYLNGTTGTTSTTGT